MTIARSIASSVARSISSAVSFGETGGGGGGGSEPTLATLPVAPTVRYHPGFSTVTESGGRVVSAVDLMGTADAAEGSSGIGPTVLTDANGRKFWRFSGAEYLTIGSGLSFENTRETTVFFVGRVPRSMTTTRILSGGSVALGTASNGSTLLDARVASAGEAPFIGNARAASTDREHMIAGAQLQVMGNLRRTTGNGGDVTFMNRKTCVVGIQGSGTTVVTGAEIGRYSFSPSTSGNWANFDLYEIVIYNARLTVDQCEEIQEALADNYSIVEVDSQLVLEGDSITQGTGDVVPALSSGALITNPGAGLIPGNWRVLNAGTSGASVSTLVTRRDATSSWASFAALTNNVVAFEIGRNDFGAAISAEDHYDNVVAYMNTTTTGLLQRGWTVRVLANIATSGAGQSSVETYRSAIRDAQFLIDTDSNTGGTYAGKVSIVDTDLIEDDSETIFLTSTDASDTTYYQGDSTHPTILGAQLRVNGGDDPTKAISYGLV